LRAGVGILVSDGTGRVLAIERRDHSGSWQLPQGGIEEDETPREAALRELREETGLRPADVELVREARLWIAYVLPEKLRSKKTGWGQAQKWFLFRTRSAGAKRRARPGDREASRVAWKPLSEVVRKVVAFRRPVYEWLAGEFGRDLA
jgi:putative (di)nucleoside polyphosphate hydrolase